MDYKQHIKHLLINNKDGILKTNANKSAVALVDILEEEISHFDYNSPTNIFYLFDMFDILIILLKDNEHLQRVLYDRFTYIHNMVRNLIHAKPTKPSKIAASRFKLLQNIINKMENTMLRIYYNNPTDYDPDKEEFIYYIIFKLKRINFVCAAIEKFPHIVNSVDKQGIPLIEKVLDKYLEALEIYLSDPNLGPLDDLIYFDKVLREIITSEKIKVDNYMRTLMLEKIAEFRATHTYESNRLKEKLSFFTNNAANTVRGKPEDNSIEYLNYKYEVHAVFKQAHILEAKTIYRSNRRIKATPIKRKIYTFDDVDAKELDDGLSITLEDGIYYVGVHIANPNAYIPYDSILMDEANKRTTSLYMGNYSIPLFPSILSSNMMSLNSGKKTYCMSHYFEIDARTGELLNYEIKEELCAITKNLTYDDFNSSIDQGTEDQEFFDTLMNLCNVSEIFKRVYKEDAIYHELHKDKDRSISQSTVEKAMIYTNYQLARLFDERGLPFIYRCHSLDDASVQQLSQLQARLQIQQQTDQMVKDIQIMKNLFPRAFYTRINTGHYGLGSKYYAHATSPLRRLADNIANECIRRFILNPYTSDDIKRMEDKIDEIASDINNKRATLEDYENQYTLRKERKEKSTT